MQEFEAWLEETDAIRKKLIEYSKSPLPRDIGERHRDMELAIQNSSDAANLLADAEIFLVNEKVKAMYKAKEDSTLTAKERELVVKDAVRIIQRIVDGLSVMNRTIHDRIYVNMNANRSRL